MIGTLSDISVRKMAEAEINRLAQAVEQNPTGILITNAEGELEFSNQAFTRITGYAFSQMYGKTQRELISSEMTDEEFQTVVARLVAGQPWSGTLLNRHRNGQLHWEQVTASPIYDESGKVSNYLYLKTDVTEQKKAEAALQERDAALARANADLTRFAEVSAHHLMEPTRRLISYTQLLRPRLEIVPGLLEDEDVGSSLGAIEHDAARLRTLVRDIQLYLAAAEPRGDVRMEEANAALGVVQQRLDSRIKAQGAVVNVQKLPPAMLDRPRLVDLFSVLLDNVLNHGQPIDSAQTMQIEISGERDGDTSRYRVCDNGPGILPEYYERVFGIFERLTGGSGESGTGIGLSIARRIVESRHGKIWIEKSPQGGTMVVFELPDGN